MAALGAPTFTVSTSNTPLCTCRSAVLELQVAIHRRDSAIDVTLNTARQAIDTWPRLKDCPQCSQIHLGDLLEVFRQLADSMHTISAVTGSQRRALPSAGRGITRGEPSLPIDTATSVGHGRSGTGLSTSREGSACKDTVPLVALGTFKLDDKQSSGLIRKVCHDLLSRLAAVLYEIQGIGAEFDGQYEGALTEVMFTVLSLIDSFEQHE